MNFSGKKVIIIGGTSGIGLETAKQLAKAGASVTVTGRDKQRAQQAQTENPTVTASVVDASSIAALQTFYANFGTFTDLVLCVSGAKGSGPFVDLTIENLMTGFQEKFVPQFHAAQLALPSLQRDGSITFVSAISARAANPGTAGLAAINGAIESMIKPLAKELKPLRVNALSPGVVETTWWNNIPSGVREKLLAQSAAASLVGRNGKPEDLADAILFLIGNGFVTGTVLEVDGGVHLS